MLAHVSASRLNRIQPQSPSFCCSAFDPIAYRTGIVSVSISVLRNGLLSASSINSIACNLYIHHHERSDQKYSETLTRSEKVIK